MAKARRLAKARSPTRSNGWVACLDMGAIGSLSSKTMARTRVKRARRATEKFALGVPSLSAMKASSSWEWRSRVRLVLPSCLPEPALFSTRQRATPVYWQPLFGKAWMSGNAQCLRRHNCHHHRVHPRHRWVNRRSLGRSRHPRPCCRHRLRCRRHRSSSSRRHRLCDHRRRLRRCHRRRLRRCHRPHRRPRLRRRPCTPSRCLRPRLRRRPCSPSRCLRPPSTQPASCSTPPPVTVSTAMDGHKERRASGFRRHSGPTISCPNSRETAESGAWRPRTKTRSSRFRPSRFQRTRAGLLWCMQQPTRCGSKSSASPSPTARPARALAVPVPIQICAHSIILSRPTRATVGRHAVTMTTHASNWRQAAAPAFGT